MPFWPLWGHFNLYFTYHSHYIQRVTLYLVPSPFVRLCIASIWLTLCSTAFLDIILCTLTSTHCILLIILHFSSRFIGFPWISLDLLLPTSDYVYGHIPTLTLLYPITIDQDIHPFITFLHIGHSQEQIIPDLRTLYHSLVSYIFYYISVGVVVFWPYSIAGCISGKKSLTSRISGPDKYQQVLLGFQRGVYRPMLEKYIIYR
jgi:hypothetical protein